MLIVSNTGSKFLDMFLYVHNLPFKTGVILVMKDTKLKVILGGSSPNAKDSFQLDPSDPGTVVHSSKCNTDAPLLSLKQVLLI